MSPPIYRGVSRDPHEAARFVARMTDEQVITYATHDPDIFRTVAKELLLYVPNPPQDPS
jgi:hypothetical protein